MFSKETYTERRNILRGKFQSGILLFPGNDESPMNYPDNPYHFRQDSTFLYYFALQRAGLFAVMDIDNGKDYIFGDDYTIDDIVWMGTQPLIVEQARKCGVENTGSLKDLAAFIGQIVKQKREIRFLPPYRGATKIQLFNLLGIHPDKQQEAASVEFIKAVVNQRNYKTEEEIKEIEKAVNTSVDMHVAAMQMVRPGITEAQIAAKVHEVALAAGGDISFPIIATINGQTLHNHYHGNVLQKGQMFLLDAGAENSSGYAGDLSSTMPVDLKFSAKQKEVYEVALAAHNAAIEALQPGVRFRDVHLLAAKTIFEGLKTLGLTKGNTGDAVQAGAHALFFPCGLGHMMGLDIHDMEGLGEQYVGYDNEPKSKEFGLKSLRLGRKLEPGFILTIEPGIYFIPELIDLWKAEKKHADFLNYEKIEEYRNFGGLRNEEDFLITETGYRLLGKPKPKTLEDVENERAKPRI